MKDDLNKMKETLGVKMYSKLFRTFKALCVYSDFDLGFDGQYFITEKSFKSKIASVFGYNN